MSAFLSVNWFRHPSLTCRHINFLNAHIYPRRASFVRLTKAVIKTMVSRVAFSGPGCNNSCRKITPPSDLERWFIHVSGRSSIRSLQPFPIIVPLPSPGCDPSCCLCRCSPRSPSEVKGSGFFELGLDQGLKIIDL